jgi:hypothetical protein
MLPYHHIITPTITAELCLVRFRDFLCDEVLDMGTSANIQILVHIIKQDEELSAYNTLKIFQMLHILPAYWKDTE